MKYVITKRDRAILIALFGILVLAGVYYFVYMGYKDKTAQLKSENQALQNRVDVLQSIKDQQADLVAQTNANKEMSEKVLKRFPSNIYEEDVILFGGALQDFAPFETIPAIGIGAPVEIKRFDDISAQTTEMVNGYIPAEVGVGAAPAPAPAEGQEGADPAAAAPEGMPSVDPSTLPVLYSRTVSLTGQTDYDGFKNAIRFIVDNMDRSSLGITANYDIGTGMLQASMNIGRYYVTGTDKPYVEPEIRDVIQGTDNIFGTIPLSEQRPVVHTTRTEEEGTEAEGEDQ